MAVALQYNTRFSVAYYLINYPSSLIVTIRSINLLACYARALLSNPPPASAGGGVKGILRQNRFMALNPMMRGSSVKTLVLSRESSLLVKKSVIGASLNRFLT